LGFACGQACLDLDQDRGGLPPGVAADERRTLRRARIQAVALTAASSRYPILMAGGNVPAIILCFLFRTYSCALRQIVRQETRCASVARPKVCTTGKIRWNRHSQKVPAVIGRPIRR